MSQNEQKLSGVKHKTSTIMGSIVVFVFTALFPTEIKLAVRDYSVPKGTHVSETIQINFASSALIIIDAWEREPLQTEAWRLEIHRNIDSCLSPLVRLFRSRKIRLIHAPSGYAIANQVRPISGETLLHADIPLNLFVRHLRSAGVDTLFFAGYATNMCLMNRTAGIINMARHGFRIIAVRDCSVAIESPETASKKWGQKSAEIAIELNYGWTTTLDDLRNAFQNKVKTPS